MPLVKLIRGIVFGGEPRSVGDVLDVTEREAFLLCEAHKDAVPLTTNDVVTRGTVISPDGATLKPETPAKGKK